MLLTEAEVSNVDNVLRCMRGNNQRFPQMQGVSRSAEDWLTNYTDIKLGNTKAHLRIYDDEAQWRLYVGNTRISMDDDGPWWDVVRSETPKLALLTEEYYKEVAAYQRRFNDDIAKQHAKALAKAAKECSGESVGILGRLWNLFKV